MNVKKCANGHFYDGDRYTSCPHCGMAASAMQASGSASESHSTDGSVTMKKVPSQEAVKTFGVFGGGNTTPLEPGLEAQQQGCPNCGYIYKPGAKFCRKCGAKLPQNASAPVEQEMPQQTVFPEAVTVPVNEKEEPQQFFEEPQSQQYAEEPQPVAMVGYPEKEVGNPVEEEAPAVENNELRSALKEVAAKNDGKTVGYFSRLKPESEEKTNFAEPVVGWLVCISGKHFGEAFRIISGRNTIGRNNGNMIVLAKDEAVSRDKQCWVIYEPKKREFYVQPGEGSRLTYLNGDMIMEVKKLSRKDILEIGDGRYMLIPLCGEDFSWEDFAD